MTLTDVEIMEKAGKNGDRKNTQQLLSF